MNTFSGFCISACIFMIFIGLASAVVNSIGAFPSSTTMDTSEAQAKTDVNIETIIWVGGTSLGALFTAAIYIITRSINLMAICIFATVFWESWGSLTSIFNNFGFTTNPTGLAIYAMLTFGMTVMFIGAVIGLLVPGSTAMR